MSDTRINRLMDDFLHQEMFNVPTHITHRIGGYLFDLQAVFDHARITSTHEFIQEIIDPHELLDLVIENLNALGVDQFCQQTPQLIESWSLRFANKMNEVSLNVNGQNLFTAVKEMLKSLTFGLLEMFSSSPMLLTMKHLRQNNRRVTADYVLKEGSTRNLFISLFETIPNRYH